MPKFNSRGTRQMQPRDNRPYATTYTLLSARERARLQEYIRSTMQEILETALARDDYAVLNPLRGFPRTQNQANYSAADIMSDLMNQLAQGRDVASGMLGRWNRLFEEFPELQIEFQQAEPKNCYADIIELDK